MRFRLPALLATAVLVTGGGTALSSCGSEEKEKGTVDIGQAAAATADKGTARMHMDMRVSGLGLPKAVKVKAHGVTALGEPRGRVSMDLRPLLELAAVGPAPEGKQDLEMTIDGPDLYAKPPPIQGLTIPDGKSWVALDLRQLAEAAGLPAEGLGALFNIDPASQLRALKAAEGLREVGEEEVDGAQTTHLAGSYRLSDVIAALPARERAQARKAVKSLERLGGQDTGVNRPVPADLWVDDDGVTRQMRATSKLPAQAGGPAGSMAITYRLSDFGTKLDTSPPPASETYDVTESLEKALKALAGR